MNSGISEWLTVHAPPVAPAILYLLKISKNTTCSWKVHSGKIELISFVVRFHF